jgi:hypothetical protein
MKSPSLNPKKPLKLAVSIAEAAAMISVSVPTLARLIREQRPKFAVRVGKRRIVCVVSEMVRWLREEGGADNDH